VNIDANPVFIVPQSVYNGWLAIDETTGLLSITNF